MIDIQYMKFHLKEHTNDVMHYTEMVYTYHQHPYSDVYRECLEKLLSYYQFITDGDEEVIIGDLLLEKNQIIKHVTITKDQLIALFRSHIIVVPEARYCTV